ncbi:DUF7715 family protein [Agromyces sp. ZXT2-6]|uniref:DUF7715 family protein n=1 Tax=Agromyces sp. ZXT2-6 TaxID=3461153 RepID=UPI004054BC39
MGSPRIHGSLERLADARTGSPQNHSGRNLLPRGGGRNGGARAGLAGLARLSRRPGPLEARWPGSCDCGITFRGMTSDEVTTTAVVRAIPGLDLAAYVDCLDATHRFRRSQGCTCDFDAVGRAWNLLAIAGLFAEGTVVERIVDRLVARRGAGSDGRRHD